MSVENVLKQSQQDLVAVLDGKSALEKSNADTTDAMHQLSGLYNACLELVRYTGGPRTPIS